MTTYAIIGSGNKQYQVKLGDVVELEKLENPGKTVTFDQVLLLSDGKAVEVGSPTIAGKSVKGEVVSEAVKGDKIRIFRFKAKSRYRKTQGHRQTHTVVKIVEIAGQKLAAPAAKKPAPAKKAPAKKTPASAKSGSASGGKKPAK